MTSPRLLIAEALTREGRVSLSADQSHYLLNVLRLGERAQVRLFNGRHGEWTGRLVERHKRACVIALDTQVRRQEVGPDLHLLFAPLKKTRTDFVVEKACELGVSAICPVFTERTGADRVNVERLSAVAREAAEQSERLDAPLVCAPQTLSAALADWDPARRILFCDEGAARSDSPWAQPGADAAPVLQALFATPDVKTGPWAVLVGPEGGFSPKERALVRSHSACVPVSLGPRVLRADTAALAALALWQSVLGDIGAPLAPSRPSAVSPDQADTPESDTPESDTPGAGPQTGPSRRVPTDAA